MQMFTDMSSVVSDKVSHDLSRLRAASTTSVVR